MKKILKRLCTGFLALATVVTALPSTPVHAESKQYWTESAERVGIIEKVMNDGSIGSTFNEGYMKVEGETAYCIDINTDFKNGYKTRADASSRMSADQISDVALSLEYVKQYGETHKELNYKQVYLLESPCRSYKNMGYKDNRRNRQRRYNPLCYKISGHIQSIWRQFLYAGRQGSSSTWNTNRRRNKSSKRLLAGRCIYAGWR